MCAVLPCCTCCRSEEEGPSSEQVAGSSGSSSGSRQAAAAAQPLTQAAEGLPPLACTHATHELGFAFWRLQVGHMCRSTTYSTTNDCGRGAG